MARNDGQNRTVARNGKYTRSQVHNIERHNERKNKSYENTDIQLERASKNIYFKQVEAGYLETFDHMCETGMISTKGLREDAVIIDEMLFDINTLYFEERGGYEYAKEFFGKAYEYAIKEAGGEDYILSAVMHADERNEEVSARLGRDVYHYHLHVMYIPVVQKEVKWSKRCKDKALVGTVKEVITQVSHSKKWASKKVMGADGRTYLEKSYSLFQDRFFHYMQECGYDDIQRGEKGSTDKHKTTLQFKADQERKRLEVISHKVNKGTKELNAVANKKAEIVAVDDMEAKTPILDKGKVLIDKNEFEDLKTLAKKHIASESKESTLKSTIKNIKQENTMLKAKNTEYKASLHEYTSVTKKLNGSKEKVRLGELEKFYEIVMKFLDRFQLKEQFERFSKGVFKNRSGVDL